MFAQHCITPNKRSPLKKSLFCNVCVKRDSSVRRKVSVSWQNYAVQRFCGFCQTISLERLCTACVLVSVYTLLTKVAVFKYALCSSGTQMQSRKEATLAQSKVA